MLEAVHFSLFQQFTVNKPRAQEPEKGFEMSNTGIFYARSR